MSFTLMLTIQSFCQGKPNNHKFDSGSSADLQSHARLLIRNHRQQLEPLRREVAPKIVYKMSQNSRLPGNFITSNLSDDCNNRRPLNGEPSPSVTTLRTRAAILSESDISVLDIGPSLHSSHEATGYLPPLRINHGNRSGLARTRFPDFMTGHPDSDNSDKASPAQTPLHASDLESVAITFTSGPVSNEIPFHLRPRRRDRPIITLPGLHGIQPPGEARAASFGYHELSDYGCGFSGFYPTRFHFSDEPDRRIHSLSVPHSPQSPPGVVGFFLPRSQSSYESSYEGMESELVTIRNVEQERASRSPEASDMAICEDVADDEEP